MEFGKKDENYTYIFKFLELQKDGAGSCISVLKSPASAITKQNKKLREDPNTS